MHLGKGDLCCHCLGQGVLSSLLVLCQASLFLGIALTFRLAFCCEQDPVLVGQGQRPVAMLCVPLGQVWLGLECSAAWWCQQGLLALVHAGL